MPELDADFEISTNNLEAEYEITQSEHFDCSFEIFAAGTPWGEITGNIEDQEDLQGILTDLQSDIDDVADDLSIETDNRQSADTDLQDNIDTVDGKIDTHIADKTNPHEVTKTQVGLGDVDNTSDLNKPISTATQTALNGKQNTINDLSDIRTNASNGQSAYNTMQNYGDIVTYDASNFATSIQGSKADTALQPNDNISELNNDAGYITSASLPTVNNASVTMQKNGTTIKSFTLNQSSNETINITVPTQASDINAVPTSRKVNNKALSSDITLTASDVNALSSSTTINDLTTTAQQNALNSGATSTNIGQITTNTNNISDINDLIPTQATSTNQLADKSFVNSSIATNTANFIGTFQSVAELEAYSGTLTNNDYAFVETTDTAGNTLYDRYKYTTATTPASWQYEYELNNSSFTANQWASINSGITSNDVTLIGTALQPNDNVSSLINDAGYITSSSLPTVNNGTLTIQQNGTNVQTFTANQSSNATANIITPTKTSDLTNDSGFIDNSALSNYATQTDLTNGLATKQDTISDLSTIRSNATNGQSAYTTIGGYGDIVTHNTSEFATSAQGGLADTSIQPNDNISLLNNDAGYTSNVGTVTSVNNNQPDANGNVTLSIPIVDSSPSTKSTNALQNKMVIDYVTSRDENLISNGFATLGSNYNFSSFNFDGSDTYGAAGCFTKEVNSSTQITTDEFMPIDITKTYKATFATKNGHSTPTQVYTYLYANMYDIDKNSITYAFCHFIENTTTTLAQDLKNGDTVVYLTDLTNWNTTTSQSYQKGFIFWNYANSFGYTYPIETYSRNVFDALYTDNSAVNKTNNTITLNSAWNKGTISAGTSLSQCTRGGSTYVYLWQGNIDSNVWTPITGILTPDMVRSGTAYVKLGWIADHNNISDVTFKISSIAFSAKPNYNEIPTKISDLTDDTATTPIDKAEYATSAGSAASATTSSKLGSSDVGSNTTPIYLDDGVPTALTYTIEKSVPSNAVFTDTTYNNFTGADGTNAGSSGLVPAPSATDNDKYLKGDGTWATVSSGSSTDVQINGTSITSGGTANIITNSAYDASSNKIATMSDLPADEVFIATYGTTTYAEITTALSQGKAVFCKNGNDYYSYCNYANSSYYFSYSTGGGYIFQVGVSSSNTWGSTSKMLQDALTAVTHTNSTQVGSSIKPIYISSTGAAIASSSTVGSSSIPVYMSSGAITSTGLSIASSRFDGQWVGKQAIDIIDQTAVGSYSYSLSSYLPSRSSGEVYIVTGVLSLNSTNSTRVAVGRIASPWTHRSNNDSFCITITSKSSSPINDTYFEIPFRSTDTSIYAQIYSNKASSGMWVSLLGYRRIGTNT